MSLASILAGAVLGAAVMGALAKRSGMSWRDAGEVAAVAFVCGVVCGVLLGATAGLR